MRHTLPALAAAVALVLPAAVTAVTVDQGDIAASGVLNTADYWFWTSDTDGTIEIGVDPLDVGPGLTGLENPVLHIYDTAFNLLASADDTHDLDPEITQFFFAGSYVAAISSSGLAANVFPPFHENGDAAQTWAYEVRFASPGVFVAIDCALEGNLDGSFGGGGAGCTLPVPTPASGPMMLLGVSLLGLGHLLSRVSYRYTWQGRRNAAATGCAEREAAPALPTLIES